MEVRNVLLSAIGRVKITGYNGLERAHISAQLSEKVGIWGIWRKIVGGLFNFTYLARRLGDLRIPRTLLCSQKVNQQWSDGCLLFSTLTSPPAGLAVSPQVYKYSKTWRERDFFCPLFPLILPAWQTTGYHEKFLTHAYTHGNTNPRTATRGYKKSFLYPAWMFIPVFLCTGVTLYHFSPRSY